MHNLNKENFDPQPIGEDAELQEISEATSRHFDILLKRRAPLQVRKENEKWQVHNSRGEVVTVFDGNYEQVGAVHEGMLWVKQGGKYGFINQREEIIVPCIYDAVRSFFNGRAAVKLNGKWGFIDHSGKVVIPLKFDDVLNFDFYTCYVCEGNEKFYINMSGTRLSA